MKNIAVTGLVIISVGFFINLYSFSEKTPFRFTDGKDTINPVSLINPEIPALLSGEKAINHKGYTLLYNESHEQASWVAYELTSAETKKLFSRTDYSGSGYDRGHLAPAADMGWSEQAMAESFYYSNMSPQTPGFNRGIWKNLEELIRSWAVEYGSVYVVTGPVLKSGLPSIGANKVSVPEYYYKVILDYSKPDVKAIGFIMKNTSSDKSLSNFAVTVDSVENITGIDFFPSLPDTHEAIIEKELCVSCWIWERQNTEYVPEKQSTSASVQCSEYTQAGTRCKRKTSSPNGKCWQHGGD
ncbi:MAG: hypothetical protein A2W91_06180 [Bacteroidetes bacterium GWF2_38_335]|nr:MAG: hypothetical protein A2W91_06180 [Bacteroidetes bacterium GWF2_38_335]OFY79663.1 MAG: hypothetical protein A2281_09500 [Bacteroidetes bacterium RIFOXYA12_FULL_38_20]HBS89014.1 DNA/RNA non-specific endonuclease [Bacteroidales bacterium]